MDLRNANSRKRCHSESFYFEPLKIYKADKSVKENISPTELKNYDQPNFSNSLQNFGKATPKKNLHSKEDPITPNTNMKLLTSLAASLDYANCSTPKSRKSEESPLKNNISSDALEVDLIPALKPSRKEKSLALVCSRFLNIYPLHPEPDAHIIVSLDEASLKLKVERRRLYDIVNVFESIDMLTKLAKNRYVWFGKNNLLKALHKIKASASKENIDIKLQYVLNSEGAIQHPKHTCILDEVQDFNRSLELDEEPSVKDLLVQTSPFPEIRKEKSLALMSQKFLMLFLVSPSRVISLGVAAKVLNGFQKNDKGAQIKTQIRRLYDIANVLSSIGLVQKEVTVAANGKKPAFKYIGPDLEKSKEKENVQTSRCKFSSSKVKPRSLIRHSSFQEICAVAELEHQKLCLDESPKSAPPFEKHLVDSNESKTRFMSWNLDMKDLDKNILNSTPIQDVNIVNSADTLRNIQSNCVRDKQPHVDLKSVKIPVQQNLKIVNFPKHVLPNNAPFYLLNSTNSDALNSTGTVLLTYAPINQLKEDIQVKSSENKVSTETMELSHTQRDAILKSLNISLSAGQIAAIQLEGNTQTTPNSQCNMLKIINKTNKTYSSKNENTDQASSRSIQKVNDLESNKSSSTCSTRNSSPSCNGLRYDSPLSIPSGYATPIPSASSDIALFPSSSEVDCILKRIENHGTTQETINKPVFPCINYSKDNMSPKFEHKKVKGEHNFKGICENNIIPKEGMQVLMQLSDSCSSESLNTEVSNILKETPLGEATNNMRSKSFLIDEKTILSPIKKPDDAAKMLTPSPLMTPPYLVPDTIFVFNPSVKFQNNGIIRFTQSVLRKVGSNNNSCDKSSPVTRS